MNLEIGTTVGDYQVVGILGAGGMGQVYKVRNVISDRVEAMKVLLPDLVNQPDLADRFLREIKVQASLEHPNIAALHTAVRVENQLLMLMEFVEGVTLDQKLKDGPLAAAQAVDYIMQVLAALDYAHARGVVHRDIKPANIIIQPDGRPALVDFGLVKVMLGGGGGGKTTTGFVRGMGTPEYAPPEQAIGRTDQRSDLYALGATLYHAMTGHVPFDAPTIEEVVVAQVNTPLTPPNLVRPEISQPTSDAAPR